LVAQPRLLSEKTAQSVAPRLVPADLGGDRRLSCGNNPALAALRRPRNHPYGILDRFRRAAPREPPPPHAIFTSNPLRGLDWLLDLWVAQIRPAVPTAELHIYAGGAVYGIAGSPRAQQMEAVLARAQALGACGVRRFPPIGREALANALLGARVMLYRGDPGETFCLALAEAQAMGVPAVTKPLGSTPERVIDEVTGRVTADDDDFAAAAVTVLRDDVLWRRWHLAALARQRGLSWDAVGARFEALADCDPH
jgi:glycosyltransferase involved in cell wall biosynthesis